MINCCSIFLENFLVMIFRALNLHLKVAFFDNRYWKCTRKFDRCSGSLWKWRTPFWTPKNRNIQKVRWFLHLTARGDSANTPGSSLISYFLLKISVVWDLKISQHGIYLQFMASFYGGKMMINHDSNHWFMGFPLHFNSYPVTAI